MIVGRVSNFCGACGCLVVVACAVAIPGLLLAAIALYFLAEDAAAAALFQIFSAFVVAALFGALGVIVATRYGEPRTSEQYDEIGARLAPKVEVLSVERIAELDWEDEEIDEWADDHLEAGRRLEYRYYQVAISWGKPPHLDPEEYEGLGDTDCGFATQALEVDALPLLATKADTEKSPPRRAYIIKCEDWVGATEWVSFKRFSHQIRPEGRVRLLIAAAPEVESIALNCRNSMTETYTVPLATIDLAVAGLE